MTQEEKEAQEEQELIDAMMAERDEPDESSEENEEEEDNGSDEQSSNEEEHSESKEEDDTRNSGDGHEDESENEDSNGEEESTKLEESDFTPIEIEVNGHNVKIESKEDMMAYIRKGADSFKQKPQTHQEETSIVKQGQLSPDDLKLLVDAKNGDKGAISKLAKLGNVDVTELDDASAEAYKAQFQPIVETAMDKVANDILADEPHAQDFKRITDTLPKDFQDAVFNNADTMSNFSRHIKSGLAQRVIPEAITSQMRNGGTFMENYTKIGQAMANADKVKIEAPKREMSQKEKDLRKKANSSSNSQSDPAPRTDTAEAVWELTDEEFAEKYGE